jgi:glycosyltransferase involved in cell wall biosynthesis
MPFSESKYNKATQSGVTSSTSPSNYEQLDDLVTESERQEERHGVSVPAISVLLPAYNASSTIAIAIRSILQQSWEDFELLVLDDGSTDDTIAVATAEVNGDPRVSIIRGGDNKGLPARLNELVSRSRAEFVARMDSDDVAFPKRLEIQIREIRERKLDILGGQVVVIDDNYVPQGVRAMPLDHTTICRRPWSGFYVVHPTWLARRSALAELPYREFWLCEDQELLLRGHHTLQLGNSTEVVLGYRETKPTFRKIKRGRTSFVRALRENRAAVSRPYVLGAAEQYVKLGVDWAILRSGLGERIHKHRKGTADETVFAAWQDVVQGLKVNDGKS